MSPLSASRRGGAVALLTVVLTIVASPALAAADAGEPDAARKAAASAHLKRGAELIDAEDLDGALAQFQAAYELVPSPSILHNFGIVYQGLGHKAAALEAFQRFLEEAVKAPPAAREHAQGAVEALRGQVAELRVQSDVAGATISVDGHRVGQTPQERPIYLDPGSHRLFVERSGVGSHTEQVAVTAGQRLTVPARLVAPPAGLTVEATPPASPVETRPWQRSTAWVAAGAATIATGVLATALVVRHLRIDEYNDRRCGTADPGQGGSHCPPLLQSGKNAETWAIASGVAAGALGVGAALLFSTLPEAGARVSLRASPSHLGLGLQGRF